MNTILIAGDSTAANYTAQHYPMMGWGQALPYFVNCPVKNFAKPGRSTKSFRDDGIWAELLVEIQPEDMVLIQFGHNDQKKNEPNLYASEEEYAENLRRMVEEVREKSGKAVLITSFPRCVFDSDNGRLLNTHGKYPQIMRETAETLHCLLIDANALAKKLFANPAKAFSYFTYPSPGGWGFAAGTQDISHFNIGGAHTMAKLICDEAVRIGFSLVGEDRS